MLFLIREALLDSLKLVPFLLVIYFGIAWLESRYEDRIQGYIRKAGKAGPLLGALFGCLPQCGFSVVGSALYTRGLITTGTLLAVFISTSDEAVPIIMAQPNRLWLILPLLGTKVALALLAGFLVDALARQPQRVEEKAVALPVPVTTGGNGHVHTEDHAHAEASLEPEPEAIEVDGCCGHHLTEKSSTRSLLLHPLLHTGQVFLVLFLVSIGINLLVGKGGAHLGALLLHGSLWQPVIAAFVGLIPNCGASVAITEVYLRGGISFGAVIAGLSSSAGLGLLVLVKDDHDLKDVLRILALLLGFSIAAGILIQWVLPGGLLPR
jgi:hypothetical protein